MRRQIKMVAACSALLATLTLAACGSAGAGNGGAYGGNGGAYGGGAASSTATSGGATGAAHLQCAAGASLCTKTVSVKGKATTALADAQGMTLYYFTPDSATTATCSAACAQAWPPLAAGASVSGAGVSGTVAMISSVNGAQVTYNGHPLYRYSGDKSQSDATGEGILGKWFVATSDLSAASSASPGGSPTHTPGGYGATRY